MNKDKYFKEYEGIEAFSVQQISSMLQLPFIIRRLCFPVISTPMLMVILSLPLGN